MCVTLTTRETETEREGREGVRVCYTFIANLRAPQHIAINHKKVFQFFSLSVFLFFCFFFVVFLPAYNKFFAGYINAPTHTTVSRCGRGNERRGGSNGSLWYVADSLFAPRRGAAAAAAAATGAAPAPSQHSVATPAGR